ncbi:2-phospho-L-lactate guanylyltransferase [Geodermatophilus sp. YIM 151500]|uniref:2-phospho-L-lactate guanylyltransferase n=1 Tax=Geodermatophilus sp. YIM 151500 TaxID=2984531 RepID=UPI0021E3A701|nr:2-phospho-L-lactate guanylyltransferase [Geodermatophilus sp. YIM 151500]MCV2488917.1 2-phospho-L-lactate guanylyltransferase [Geodermatophilus sp. YIM 151500]
MGPWSVVVPAKRLPAAKTRLRPLTARTGGDAGPAPADPHADLVLALLADTLAAALACPAVAALVVVTDDPAAADLARGLGAVPVPDVPDRGLNPALAHGAAAATALTGSAAVAALSSDLPALRPEELAGALGAAGVVPVRRSFVADAQGTGTTLLAAAGGDLDPRFGRGSAAAHAASGALALGGGWPGLRRDVDSPDDLATAARLGLGPRTAAVLGRWGAHPVRGTRARGSRPTA